MKTKNAVINYHDLSLVHETQKILPISDAMFEKGKKFSGGSPLEKNYETYNRSARVLFSNKFLTNLNDFDLNANTL